MTKLTNKQNKGNLVAMFIEVLCMLNVMICLLKQILGKGTRGTGGCSVEKYAHGNLAIWLHHYHTIQYLLNGLFRLGTKTRGGVLFQAGKCCEFWILNQLFLIYFDMFRTMVWFHFESILCLTSRTTVTSARTPEDDACHRVRNLCVFSHVQKGTPGLTRKRMRLVACILERAQWRHGRFRDETKYSWKLLSKLKSTCEYKARHG